MAPRTSFPALQKRLGQREVLGVGELQVLRTARHQQGREPDALDRAGLIGHGIAGALEAMGMKPLLVTSGAQNFKVTYPEDFAMAEAVLRGRAR